jgi:ribosomal-protein-alanine N-acetyltransferase
MLQSIELSLIPMKLHHLQLLAESREKLEKHLNLVPTELELSDPDFLNEFNESITSYLLPQVAAHPDTFEWYTNWLIIDKKTQVIIGGIGVSGLPDESAQTMIGYFVDKNFEGKGVATQAVKLLTAWLFQNENLHSIIADIPPGHVGSQKVLEKANFRFSGSIEGGHRWILSKTIIN